jgi:hypothetical protein
MILAFITSLINAPRAYVWQPSLTLTDPAIVSQLTQSIR